jgi:hypothetical protein
VVEKIVEFRRRILAELPFQMNEPEPAPRGLAREIQFPAGKS